MTMKMNSLVDTRPHDGGMSEENPSARPRKRSFTASYKLGIVDAYESLTEPGAKGALLRREGLYHSHIVEWRRARDAGALQGLAATAGRPRRSPEEVENERLRRENEGLRAELSRTKTALEIMGKAHALLEQLSESADTDPRSRR